MADYPVSIELVRRKLLDLRDAIGPTGIAVLNMAMQQLEGLPAMTVANGRWETQGRDAVCSVCKYIQVGAYRAMWYSPYCPSCGAKMNGGKP